MPFARGIILRTLVKKPKKPNSANRKCVRIRLAKSGREITSYIPGEGHTLQEHQTVLVHVKKRKDIGVKSTCIRGKYDLAHVIKKTS